MVDSNLFTGLIQQIGTYLPDNQGLGKREGSHTWLFSILKPEMANLGTRLVYRLSYAEGKANKSLKNALGNSWWAE